MRELVASTTSFKWLIARSICRFETLAFCRFITSQACRRIWLPGRIDASKIAVVDHRDWVWDASQWRSSDRERRPLVDDFVAGRGIWKMSSRGACNPANRNIRYLSFRPSTPVSLPCCRDAVRWDKSERGFWMLINTKRNHDVFLVLDFSTTTHI